MSTRPNDMPLQTKASVAADLQHLGVRSGQLLMVHSSLSSIGYVLKLGPIIPIAALQEAVDRDAVEKVTLIKHDPQPYLDWILLSSITIFTARY